MVVEESPGQTVASAPPKLFRGVISSPDLQLPLTCGSLQASRLAWLHSETYAFSSGTTVLTVEAPGTGMRTGVSLDAKDGNAMHSSIADDYLVPHALPALRAYRIIAHSTHRLEIQSLVAASGRLASTDPYGRTVVSSASETSSALVMLTPPDVTHGAAGWAGAAFPSTSTPPSAIAVARAGFRDVIFFDGEVCVRTLHTQFAPAAVHFSDVNILALAEGSFVSLYDVRSYGKRREITRRVCSSGPLLALTATPDGATLLATGADRAVHALDAQSLAPRGRWGPCLKYEAAGVVAAGDNCAAVVSVDNEIAIGALYGEVMSTVEKRTLMLSGAAALAGGNRRRCGFRADVRVVGIARAEYGAIATLSEAGALYVVCGT